MGWGLTRIDHDRLLWDGAAGQLRAGSDPGLGRYRRTRLLSGGALVSGISGAFFALDVGLSRDIVVARRAMEIGHVKPVRGPGSGWRRSSGGNGSASAGSPSRCSWLARQPSCRTPPMHLAWAGWPRSSGPWRCSERPFRFLGGLRVLTRSGGLARCLPFSLARIKLASITVPAIVVAIWTGLVDPPSAGFGDLGSRRNLSDAC